MLDAVEIVLDTAGSPTTVGTAHFSLRRGTLSTSFAYDAGYIARPGSFAIDPTLPLRLGAFHCAGLPGALRDSAPDRWGRRIILKRHQEEARTASASVRTLDEVDYLLGASDNARQGALRYRRPGEPVFLSPAPNIPPLVQLPRLLAASRSISRDTAGHDEIKALLDAGTGSLGGARPKASVVNDGRLLIAKFSHDSDAWNVMAWEKTALDLAAKVGIAVPRRRLLSVDDQRVLLLERFDRQDGRIDGARIPYLSAMSLLGAQDGDARDYAEVGEALEVWALDVHTALEDLFRRIAFSIAIHNTDDHLRNLGLLRINGSWRLAPAFDLNPEPSLEKPRATALFGTDQATSADNPSSTNSRTVGSSDEVAGAQELARAWGIQRDRAASIVRTVVDAVAGTWQAVARANGCPEAEMRLFEPVFRNRTAALSRTFGV